MRPRWTGALFFVMAILLALVPMTANAAALPAPELLTPSANSTVDQPLFSWRPVADAESYEIEVALDDQFVTVTDRHLVQGTTYVPTFSYLAKSHYWHVRAISTDHTEGEWSSLREFTRRWTRTSDPAGQEQTAPGSRVEQVQLIGGGSSTPINRMGVQWDPVAGASHYEVEFSEDPDFAGGQQDASMVCHTPHSTITPYGDGGYLLRDPIDECKINAPYEPEFNVDTWTLESSSSRVTVQVNELTVEVGDVVEVTYLDKDGFPQSVPRRVIVLAIDEETPAFTISTEGKPDNAVGGDLRWFKPEMRLSVGETYFVRVRALDVSTSTDYPGNRVVGIWSDHRDRPDDPEPSPLQFTVGEPLFGDSAWDEPALPVNLSLSGTDVPVLMWEPHEADPWTDEPPDEYRVTIALDNDFTDPVGRYSTRSTVFIPNETYDDYGAHKRYYWFAVPCYDGYCVPARKAIHSPHVGTFSKRSAPVQDMSRTSIDFGANVLLRWGDALAAAQTIGVDQTPGGVERYLVEFTTGSWSGSPDVETDNLAYSTAIAPLEPGKYRWRVRPLDGQAVPLAWAYGPDFTIEGSDEPSPSPTSPTPLPSTSAPAPVYQAPGADEGAAAEIAPDPPGKPRVTKVSKRRVRVHWRESEELGQPVSAYLVYRSTNGTSFKRIRSTTSQTTRIKVKRGRTYWFYVVADSDAGRSGQSPTTRFRMPR